MAIALLVNSRTCLLTTPFSGVFQLEKWLDISRAGTIKGMSEFTEFVFSKSSASPGLLGGTPGARAALRAAAKADAKEKAKSATTTRRRETASFRLPSSFLWASFDFLRLFFLVAFPASFKLPRAFFELSSSFHFGFRFLRLFGFVGFRWKTCTCYAMARSTECLCSPCSLA